jgi:hypothetical protein
MADEMEVLEKQIADIKAKQEMEDLEKKIAALKTGTANQESPEEAIQKRLAELKASKAAAVGDGGNNMVLFALIAMLIACVVATVAPDQVETMQSIVMQEIKTGFLGDTSAHLQRPKGQRSPRPKGGRSPKRSGSSSSSGSSRVLPDGVEINPRFDKEAEEQLKALREAMKAEQAGTPKDVAFTGKYVGLWLQVTEALFKYRRLEEAQRELNQVMKAYGGERTRKGVVLK